MKKIIIFSFLITLTIVAVFGQTESKETVTVGYDVTYNSLELRPKNKPELIGGLKDLLQKGENYTLYQISPTNPLTNTNLHLDNFFKTPNIIKCDQVSSNDGHCKWIVVNFSSKKLSAGFYVIEIRGLKDLTDNQSDAIMFQVSATSGLPSPKLSIVTDINGDQDKLRIRSDSDITVPSTVTVVEKKYKISPDNRVIISTPTNYPAKVLDNTAKVDENEPNNYQDKPATAPQTGKQFTILLNKKLSRGDDHSLEIENGVQGQKTEGKIKYPGLPSDPSKLNLETSFTYTGEKRSKPVYNLKFKYDAQDLIPLGNTLSLSKPKFPWYFQPKIEMAIGFGASKADNTISVDLPFRTTIELGKKERFNRGDAKFKDLSDEEKENLIPKYYGWKQTSWKKGNAYFFIGPKLESDRKFKRVNLLGSLRVDFRSYRWLAGIAQKRQLLIGRTLGVEKDLADLVEINSGNTFIPYIGIDFGGKITNETIQIKNKNLSETIPKYKIFRSYIGFNDTLETQFGGLPINLSIQERLFHLATQERIGSIGDGIIDIRKVKGFQHYGSFAFDLFFNQMRRYSLNITLENGRKAPNFEYLNKVTAGFKVRY